MSEIYKPFKNFAYFGINVTAYTNHNNEIKKYPLLPNGWTKLTKQSMKKVYDAQTGTFVEPNGIAIMTELSDISTIDVDETDKCIILDKLLQDCKFIVKTRKGYHFYFKNTDKLPRREICKEAGADINTQLLYYVPEYKHTETGETFNYELIKSKALVDMPEYAINWCLTIISLKNKSTPSTSSKTHKNTESIIINPSIQITKFSINTMKIIYEIFNDSKLFDTYEGWRDIGYMSRHLNNSEECFKLYDTFCRKVKGYEKEPEANNRKMFFGKGDYNENFNENGVLLKCKKLNIKKYKECLECLLVSRYQDEINFIDTEFIYQKSTMHIFNDWHDGCKILAIKSPYGTGKTYAFKKIMDTNKFNRVLFITYRQSLAHSLTLELKERYGFDNYLNNNEIVDGEKLDIKKSNRLIIQLDSLYKIIKPYNYLLQKDGIPTFDLVVLDEIEGLLNHLSYSQINQHQIYHYLEKIVKRAPKVLALDGDMNDRSYDFLSGISNDYKFYVNKYKSTQKNFIFTHDGLNFDKQISDDLKNGKNIVIVCMSKTASEKYNQLYKKKYNVCIHNSIEKNRDKLLNVKEEWKCNLLIYSPTVESGVDFDVKDHFYKCYCVLSDKSTSYRALCQMLNRVRHYQNNDILCFIDEHMCWSTDDITYTADEVKLTKYSGIEVNNLVNVLIHNDTEKINNSNYFISSLLSLIKSKGHTYKYLDDNPSKSKISGAHIVKQQIIKADDIDSIKYTELNDKAKRNIDLTRDESNSVTKYLYYSIFGLNSISDVNEDFLKDHFNKFYIIKNLNAINISKEDRGDKIVTEYFKNFKFDKVDKLKALLEKFGFKIEDKVITKLADVEKEVIHKEIESFLTDRKIRTLFNLKKDSTIKYHYSDLNNILESYGLEIKDKKKSVKVNKKVETKYIPNIVFTKLTSEYLDRIQQQDIKDKEAIYLNMLNDPLLEGVPITAP